MKIKKHPTERGQALILIVLGIVALIGLTSLSIDGGRAFSDRRHAQNAADTAALAAALKKARGDTANWQNAGLQRAADNGYDNNGVTNTVTVVSPPTEGPYAGNAEYVQVIIVSHVETYFAPVLGIDQVTNRVQAVARAKPPTTGALFFGHAVVGLAPHECKAVKYQGNANTLITGSGLFVNSDCCGASAAFFNNSSSAALSIPDGGLTSVGCVEYKPGAINASITTGASPFPYPPPYNFPDPSTMCSGTATKTGNTLSGGYWSGNKFPPSGVTNLASNSVFCVSASNSFEMNAGDTLTGHNVTIVLLQGDIKWNGGATIQLDAPNSGPYAGLLIYVPLSNSATITINGNSASTFTGTILAPASDISILGTGGTTGLNSQVIGYTVDLSGTSDTWINYNDADNWDATVPASIELTQ